MSDTITPGNKRDKWTLRATELLNWLIDHKSAVLTAGDNITLTPQEDGTIEISASGGGEGTVTDVLVDGVSVVNQDGEAEITLPTVPSDLDDLDDVSLSSPTNGQTLKYNSTTQKWENDNAGGGNVDDVKVNGTSVVDENKVAQIISYKEVTQAEYDALPASKNSDGIAYFIKDANLPSRPIIYSPIIYSLEERCVGVWLDGRPLYAKSYAPRHLSGGQTIEVEAFNQAEKYFVHSDFVWSPGWNLGTSAASTNWHYWSLQGLGQSGWNESVAVTSAQVYVQENKLYFRDMGNSQTAGCTITGTIYYVKMADTPGSGKWAQDGIPAVHYSTDEKVIGTWIDGRTHYRKTFVFNNTTVNSGVGVNISDLHINEVTKLEGMWIRHSNSNADLWYVFGHQENSNYRSYLRVDSEDNYGINGRLVYQIWSDGTTKQVITIEYTKTTD